MKLRNCCLMLLPTIFLVLVSCQQAQDSEQTSGITVIEGATVIDGVSDTPIEDAILVLEGDTISELGPRGTVEPPANARIVSAAGKTIMPAMFALHTHLGRAWNDLEAGEEQFNQDPVQRDTNAYLYYGVTHALLLGTDHEEYTREFRTAQREGRAGGARLYSAAEGFGAKDGWPPGEVNRPTTPEEAREMTRHETAKNPPVLKLWLDDRLGTLPVFLPEIYGAVIDEAHKQNVKVIAHVFYLEEAKELMRRGVDAFAHSVRDQEVDEEFLTLAKENGITQVTSLAAHHLDLTYAEGAAILDDPGIRLLNPPSVWKRLLSEEYRQEAAQDSGLPAERRHYQIAVRNTAKVRAASIPIAVGTDSSLLGRFAGLWEHRELELLVEAGLTPMEAIRASTINSAKLLGVGDRFGTLAPGKVADFIVLNADPLADITNTRNIDAVWMNGEPVNRGALAPNPIPSQ